MEKKMIKLEDYEIKISEDRGVFYADVYNKKISPYCIFQGIQEKEYLALYEAEQFVATAMFKE